jgi:hypothetical protein
LPSASSCRGGVCGALVADESTDYARQDRRDEQADEPRRWL